MTLTEGEKTEVELGRVMAVSVNWFEERRVDRSSEPKLPPA
jgi:hypothetical protein